MGPDNKNVLTFFFNFWGNLNILCRYIVKGTIIMSRVGVFFFSSGWERGGGCCCLFLRKPMAFAIFQGEGGSKPLIPQC